METIRYQGSAALEEKVHRTNHVHPQEFGLCWLLRSKASAVWTTRPRRRLRGGGGSAALRGRVRGRCNRSRAMNEGSAVLPWPRRPQPVERRASSRTPSDSPSKDGRPRGRLVAARLSLKSPAGRGRFRLGPWPWAQPKSRKFSFFSVQRRKPLERLNSRVDKGRFRRAEPAPNACRTVSNAC